MTHRLAGWAKVAIVAASILVGTGACGSDTGPAAERSDPDTVLDTALDTVPETHTSATEVGVPGVSEAEVIELEQQLDEIDRVLADLEAQLAQD